MAWRCSLFRHLPYDIKKHIEKNRFERLVEEEKNFFTDDCGSNNDSGSFYCCDE